MHHWLYHNVRGGDALSVSCYKGKNCKWCVENSLHVENICEKKKVEAGARPLIEVKYKRRTYCDVRVIERSRW